MNNIEAILLYFAGVIFMLLAAIIVRYECKFAHRRFKLKIKLMSDFIIMLKEHSGDPIILAEIKALEKKIGKEF